MKLYFLNLGCPKNQVDLEYLMAAAIKDNHSITDDVKDADAAIINSCGFIESAVSETIEEALLAKKSMKKGAKLIVVGCTVGRYGDTFKEELPEVDFSTPNGKLGEVILYLRGELDASKAGNSVDNYTIDGERITINSNIYAYVKVGEGCSNKCTFCTIPSIRGTSFHSRPINDIVSEVKSLIKNGIKEIILISQDTSKYGTDLGNNTNLISLLKAISDIEGDFYIRIMYTNPESVDDTLIDYVATNDKIIKYFDIPCQHGSNKILKLMGRKTTREEQIALFNKIHSRIPNATIRTTFIVGFPQENDDDFNELVDFIKQAKPDYAGFFAYSPEEGTPAAKLAGAVELKATNKRIDKLEELQQKITTEKFNSLIGKETECIVENVNEDFDFILEGRILNQAPDIDGKTYINSETKIERNDIYKCKIEKFEYPDLFVSIKTYKKV